MSQPFDFRRLVELCRRTHAETRYSAVRTVARLAHGRDKHEVRGLAHEGRDELPTIGILLCDRKNDVVVELTLPKDADIYASKYQLYLPSRQDLADQVARARREIEEKAEGADG